jgi:hypothetical protein
MTANEKPQRLYFKTYLQVIRNSVGSNMFRNFYVKTSTRGEFDALDDGENSCAFYVSSILVIFNKIARVHGLVERVVNDMNDSGWIEVDQPKTGDVLVWEAAEHSDGLHTHIGFYMGNNRAISTSSTAKTPAEHDMNFGEAKRKITHIFRTDSWDDGTVSASGAAR